MTELHVRYFNGIMFVSVLLCFVLFSSTTSEYLLLHGQREAPWSAYYSMDPKDWSREKLLRNFPDVYGLSNDSDILIGPAQNFTVTPIEREALELGGTKNFHYPGAVVTFYPPEYGAVHVTGYEIHLYKNTGPVYIIVDCTKSNSTSQDHVELELYPLYGLTHYQLSVTSLPMYSISQKSNNTDLVTGVFGLYKTETTLIPPSANWYASVAFEVIDDDIENGTLRSVEIVFSRPPPEYNFQQFEIVLVPKDGSSDIRKARTTKLFHVFENIRSGNHKVMMWPVDEYFSHPGRCLCRVADGFCSNCVTTVVEIVIP